MSRAARITPGGYEQRKILLGTLEFIKINKIYCVNNSKFTIVKTVQLQSAEELSNDDVQNN